MANENTWKREMSGPATGFRDMGLNSAFPAHLTNIMGWARLTRAFGGGIMNINLSPASARALWDNNWDFSDIQVHEGLPSIVVPGGGGRVIGVDNILALGDKLLVFAQGTIDDAIALPETNPAEITAKFTEFNRIRTTYTDGAATAQQQAVLAINRVAAEGHITRLDAILNYVPPLTLQDKKNAAVTQVKLEMNKTTAITDNELLDELKKTDDNLTDWKDYLNVASDENDLTTRESIAKAIVNQLRRTKENPQPLINPNLDRLHQQAIQAVNDYWKEKSGSDTGKINGKDKNEVLGSSWESNIKGKTQAKNFFITKLLDCRGSNMTQIIANLHQKLTISLPT